MTFLINIALPRPQTYARGDFFQDYMTRVNLARINHEFLDLHYSESQSHASSRTPNGIDSEVSSAGSQQSIESSESEDTSDFDSYSSSNYSPSEFSEFPSKVNET